MYMRNSNGPKTEPCGTPDSTYFEEEDRTYFEDSSIAGVLRLFMDLHLH